MSPRRRSRIVAAVLAAFSVTFATTARAETLTLQQAIDMGVQKSPNVREARARIDSADATTSAARAGYFPTLTAGASGGYFNDVSHGSQLVRPQPSPQNPNPAQIEVKGRQASAGWGTGPFTRIALSWKIFDFGKTSNAVGQQEANYRASQANERETTQQTAGVVATAYLNLYFQEKLFELATSTLDSRDRLFAIAKGLVKAGIQPPVEELRSQSRLEAARRDQARAKAALEDARVGLAMLLGYDQASSLKVTTPRLAKASADNATAMKDAETKRATVAQAEANIERARDAVDFATAQYFPTVSLTGSVSYSHRLPDDLVNPQTSRGIFAGVQIDWTLDLSTPARVDAASADVVAAEASLEQTKRDAKTEAARAAIQVRMGQTQLEHAKKAEEATGQARAVIEARYIRGLSNPLELIEAEDSDLSARVTRLQTELDYSTALVRLSVLTGRPITDEGGGGSKDKDKDKDKEP